MKSFSIATRQKQIACVGFAALALMVAFTAAAVAESRIPTEEESLYLAERAERIEQIRNTFAENDYETYLELTDGSMHQLSEAAFMKKARFLALKDDVRDALQNRDYDTFVAKNTELRELLSDTHRHLRHEKRLITEEEFNALADKSAGMSESDFFRRGYHSSSWHIGKKRLTCRGKHSKKVERIDS
ncbi:MAG: hypothetical protein OYG31_00910 [Candidatus Kaiserbacteria bacterium]|nr:hypothetical protein [Candidatus Kaiserbacteria bacterium]